MSVTVYKGTNFQGVYAQLRPGFYSGRDLVGCPHQSTSCEDLDNAINSIRVDPNIIVAFADGHAISASGGGARVLIGPAEISDLTALGMSNRISSVLAVPYRAYDSAIPAPDSGATLYDSYGMTGRRSLLRRGDYTPARLASEEVKLPGPSVMSLAIASGVIVILYNGPNFETTSDAVMAAGPTVIEDLDRLGMGGRVHSIRVLYSDPFDVPNRPTLGLGSARAYTPGGGLGYAPVGGRGSYAPVGGRGSYARVGARDLLMMSDDPYPDRAAPAPPQQPPIVYIYDRDTRKDGATPKWMIFALIVVFILVVATAAYLAASTSKGAADRRAAEASLVAQAAVPLAVTAALL